MIPKPKHLAPKYGAQFQDPSIVAAYKHRPPYPEATFDILDDLIVDEPRRVLDVGCGPGRVARYLVNRVDAIDAVDLSEGMIEVGKTLPDGRHPSLNWIIGAAETVPLNPPYALITAGQSLHWMDWYSVMPRFAKMLTPNGVLAIVGHTFAPQPWIEGTIQVIQRLSTNRDFQPYDLVEELKKRRLWTTLGRKETVPTTFTQSIDDSIESWHSRNGLSRDRMSTEAVATFDREVRALMEPYCPDGVVQQQFWGHVTWGKPHGDS